MRSPVYFAPGAPLDVIGAIPALARLVSAGPWQTARISHPIAGEGVAATWAGMPTCNQHEVETATGWRKCHDGLWYLPPSELPDQALLARERCPRGVDLDMSTGVTLTIPLAAASPRAIDLASGAIGDAVAPYAREAYALFDRIDSGEKVVTADPHVHRVVMLALQACYRVTPELLVDLAWITTDDLDPILSAVLGSHPKASSDAAGTSPSSPGV